MSGIFPMGWSLGDPEDWTCPVRYVERETWTGTAANTPVGWTPDAVLDLANGRPVGRVEEVVKSVLAPDIPKRPIWGIWQTQAWPSGTRASTNASSFVTGDWFRGNGVVFHTLELCVALAQLFALRGEAAFAGLNAEYHVRRIDLWAARIHDRAGDMWQEN